MRFRVEDAPADVQDVGSRSYGLRCPVTLGIDPQRHQNHEAPDVGITRRGWLQSRTRKE